MIRWMSNMRGVGGMESKGLHAAWIRGRMLERRGGSSEPV